MERILKLLSAFKDNRGITMDNLIKNLKQVVHDTAPTSVEDILDIMMNLKPSNAFDLDLEIRERLKDINMDVETLKKEVTTEENPDEMIENYREDLKLKNEDTDLLKGQRAIIVQWVIVEKLLIKFGFHDHYKKDDEIWRKVPEEIRKFVSSLECARHRLAHECQNQSEFNYS